MKASIAPVQRAAPECRMQSSHKRFYDNSYGVLDRDTAAWLGSERTGAPSRIIQ